MNPDQFLRELRVALAVLLPRRARLIAIAGEDYKRDELDDLIDAAAALDLWLSKGGWLPDAWSVRTEVTEVDPFPAAMGAQHGRRSRPGLGGGQ